MKTVYKDVRTVRRSEERRVCMANNGWDTKHTRHITRRMHFLRKGEKCKMHKIDWCEGGLQLAEIGTMNVSEPDLTQRMKYMVVRLEN